MEHVHLDIYNAFIAAEKDSPEIKRLKILQNAVETVAVNGRPFKWLLDSGYRANIANKLKKLQLAGCPLNLFDHGLHEVKAHLRKMAQNVILKIKEEIKGRVLSLMVDITTKNKRSIFGISIQYIKDAQLKIRSIGMIELHESHTGVYLSKLVCERLQKFGIELCQILTITTDNGSNVVKMIRDVVEHLQNDIESNVSPACSVTETTTIGCSDEFASTIWRMRK